MKVSETPLFKTIPLFHQPFSFYGKKQSLSFFCKKFELYIIYSKRPKTVFSLNLHNVTKQLVTFPGSSYL